MTRIKPNPTPMELFNFNGAHCKSRWKSLPSGWECPACGRYKHQIVHMVKNDFGGWRPTWQVDKHHDHGADYGFIPRFESTNICHCCNSADGFIKRKFSLPREFSFSPGEIRKFVIATPHQKHVVNSDIAYEIFHKTIFYFNYGGLTIPWDRKISKVNAIYEYFFL
jgi:hypothetical protein